MSRRKVLDSYALIAFLENGTGSDKVFDLIRHARDTEDRLLLSVVSWGEIYYILYKTAGKKAADQALQDIDTLPIEIVPVDCGLARVAAELKSKLKLTYTDCFAAALAKIKRVELITGDPDFNQIEKEVRVFWL
ncbi:MAG: type II toxin-antitoxin system VapC family toxin [bacterium]|nr:type II toxin-antitoxin system VapC family toxin [bacterium]